MISFNPHVSTRRESSFLLSTYWCRKGGCKRLRAGVSVRDGFDPRAAKSRASALKLTGCWVMKTCCNQLEYRGQQKSLCDLRKRKLDFTVFQRVRWYPLVSVTITPQAPLSAWQDEGQAFTGRQERPGSLAAQTCPALLLPPRRVFWSSTENVMRETGTLWSSQSCSASVMTCGDQDLHIYYR